nr:hypothetical protein [uncultured bacterium]
MGTTNAAIIRLDAWLLVISIGSFSSIFVSLGLLLYRRSRKFRCTSGLEFWLGQIFVPAQG